MDCVTTRGRVVRYVEAMRVVMIIFLLAGCAVARPLPTSETAVARELASHFRTVYPSGGDVGVMRPRFGIPAILDGEQRFDLVVLARGQAAQLSAALVDAGGNELALDIERTATQRVAAGFFMHTLLLRAQSAIANGAYDLVVYTGQREVERQRRVVFARGGAAHRLSIVQLSDIHLGHDAKVPGRLAQVIADVNTLAPDLVVVTGDMAEQGRRGELEDAARTALEKLDAPVLAIIGNHDYGHFPTVRHANETDRGYYHFARAFHGYRLFATTIGDTRLIGFDSGPSLFSLRIATRGIDDQTLETIDKEMAGTPNVVLFSHAPTRAALPSSLGHHGARRFGTMTDNAAQLETIMRAAAARGQRVAHLAGHTHWSDLFVDAASGYRRVGVDDLVCGVPLDEPLALVTAPSATRITFPTLAHGRAYGFAQLVMAGEHRRVTLALYDASGRPRTCATSSQKPRPRGDGVM